MFRKFIALVHKPPSTPFRQTTIAARIGISQSAYAQQEAASKPRKATREKIAHALGISPEFLDV